MAEKNLNGQWLKANNHGRNTGDREKAPGLIYFL